MLTIPPSVRILLATAPTDMRRSFDALAALVDQVVGEDPLSGHLFVFHNRRGDLVKVLCWDRTGYWIWYKRLEQGVFRFPTGDTPRVECTAPELALLLEGIDLAGATRQPRYRRDSHAIPANG